MSALRSAISYIKSLQSLVADCDAGKLGDEVYTDSRRLDSVTSLGDLFRNTRSVRRVKC